MKGKNNILIDAISVVISVSERGENLLDVLKSYQTNLIQLDMSIEYIIVLAPQYSHFQDSLNELNSKENPVRIVVLNRNYGEAGEMKIGVEHSKYEYILTLPPYEQIEASNIPQILASMDDNDVVVVNRWPRIDPILNKLQFHVFRAIFKFIAFESPKDPGSGIRLVKKYVFEDIKLYGDMHRFFKVLADQAGFKTTEINIPQSKSDAHRRLYNPRTYLSRTLDILTVGFLTRFNQKPLRFFGIGGAISGLIGLFGLGYITIDRLFFNISAADRPLLVLCALFFVLGVQLIAIGLVGETIIFTSAKKNKGYRIKKIIN